MVRMLLVAVIVLTAITEAMADTGIYECTAKSQLEVGSDGLPEGSWKPVTQSILFDVQSGLLVRSYEYGEAERDNFDVIGRGLLAKSVLSDQPVRSDVTAYKKLVYPAGEGHFSDVLWSFSINFGSAGGNGKFLLVIRQTVVTGICKEL